jgi:hypothetical protein
MRPSSGIARARILAASLADVTEGTAYGSPALKVGGKMFACIPIHRSAEAGSLAVRMSVVERDLRIKLAPDKYYVTPHYVGHPVVLARLNRLDDDELKDLLEVGWQFERGKLKRRRAR